jgi:serine/threonine-protein kinase 24/25/MST4
VIDTPGSRPLQREPSDEYEDYNDEYADDYADRAEPLQQKPTPTQLEDELPDTTMLDSVILPAIATVSVRPPTLSS